MDNQALSVETPRDIKSKKYELKDKDNNKYVLIITLNNNTISFDVNALKGKSNTYSKNNLTIEDLHKLCWVFFRYNDIYTLFDKAFSNMKENQIELIKTNYNISIIRKFYQDEEIIKAKFDLYEKNSNSTKKSEDLSTKVFEQDKIINDLKDKINSQDIEINELKQHIENQQKLIMILFNEL